VGIVVNLLPVERRVLRHEVLQGLRNGILSGEIAPGTRLLEVPLANELGVSRGPVREALRQLEQEGLVEFFPHRGAVVVGVAEAEVETIYGIRALLEGRAFARACRVVTDDDLDALAETVELMITASEAGDVAAVTEHDLQFHGRVVEISGFQYLRRLWTSIDGVVRSRTANSAARPELANPVEARDWLIGPSIEHRELVDALRSRRPAVASRAATQHVTRGLERLRADNRR
jgi:DNA-binding GntR family transcriptional regulator